MLLQDHHEGYIDWSEFERNQSLIAVNAFGQKGGIKSARSLEVAFLTDETAFRWTYRINGAPKWRSPLTPKNGGGTLSTIVTLTTRT